MKILCILLFCGIWSVKAGPNNSLSIEKSLSFENTSFAYLTESGSDLQQQISVSGTITDAVTGQAMPGVNVVVKGTVLGVLSDANGKYTLSVPNLTSVVSFSFIGYITQDITLSGQRVLDVSMSQSVEALDEVVVIGYGTIKKKDLTGSVGSISTAQLKEVTVTRVEQALLGKVAGVQVKPVTGEPGAGPQIRVRGIGSISAGVDPLYVVDGFPTGDIQMLNPNDIESIDILKDASATAIYGSRGANGVIIINTKRGKTGKTVYTFDTYYGLQKYLSKPVYMTALEQANYYFDGIKNRNIDAGNNISGDPVTQWTIKVPVEIVDVIEGRITTNTDWHKEVLRTAPQQQYQMTATGGTETVKFALSGEALNQDGIVINTNFKRYSIRSNIDAQLSKRLAIKVNLNPSYTISNAVTSEGVGNGPSESIIGTASAINSFMPVYNADGTYFVMNGLAHGGNFYNAVASAKEIKNELERVRILGNVNAEYTIMEGLKLNVLLGINQQSTSQMKFKPKLPALLNEIAYGEDRSSSEYNWLAEYTLNYVKSFGKHNITGLVGYTAQKDKYRSNFLRSDQYPNNLVPALSAVGGVITNGTSTNGAWSLVSYLARLNYNYDGKYLVTASIRSDGSSRFGSKNKYGLFPSMALAWRISQENFLKDASFLTELKLRASYGETGNNNIGDFEQYATINYENYTLNGLSVGGFAQGRIDNPFLTWEKQKQLNTGIDMSFFKGRLLFTADYFHSINSDLLLNVNIPFVTGYTTSLQNIGEVKNTGWEFVISTRNIQGKFEWSTDFNISTYKNEVLKLGPEGDPIYSGGNVTQIGKPIGMFYGWLTDGIFMNQAELDNGPIFSPGTSVRSRMGDVRFVDVTGPDGVPDGVINSLDKTIMGTPYPDFYYGMTNRFAYKSFSLSISIQGSQGNEIMNLVRYPSFCRARTKQSAEANNYWKSEADPGDGGRFSFRPNDAPTGNVRGEYSQLEVYDGSYLRINNISLSYLLPATVAQKLMLSSLRVYVNVSNPFIFTSYPFWNPDTSNRGEPLQPGRDFNDYPITKSLLIGLNLAF